MIATRICPRHKTVIATLNPVEVSFELEPLDQSHRSFERRIPPLTQEELRSMDRVRWVAAGHGGVKS